MKWQPIASCPKNQTVLFANFSDMCLLRGEPHVWAGELATKFVDSNGKMLPEEDPRMMECSHAATNENGEPTHWAPMYEHPDDYETYWRDFPPQA